MGILKLYIFCKFKNDRSIMTLCFTFLFFSQLNLSQSLSRGESLILILNPEQPLLHTSSTKFLSFGISTSFLWNIDKLLISDEWFINWGHNWVLHILESVVQLQTVCSSMRSVFITNLWYISSICWITQLEFFLVSTAKF